MAIFASFCVISDRPPAFWWLSTWRRVGPRHDAVGVNCKKGTTTDVKAQVHIIWAKGCMLDDCECII